MCVPDLQGLVHLIWLDEKAYLKNSNGTMLLCVLEAVLGGNKQSGHGDEY